MSSKCEDLNPGTDISNDVVNEGDKISLAEAIGGPLAACRPTGYFRVFIHRKDPVHYGEKGRIDGINTKFPKIPGNKDGKGNEMQGGEPAEAFDGFIDLNWDSKNFGDVGENFYNTRLGNVIWSEGHSKGVYNGNNNNDKYYYDKIRNHPNTANALKLALMDFKKYADYQKIPHDEVIRRFGDNKFLADNYKLIVDNNIEFDDLIEGGMVNYLTADGKNFGNSVGIATTTDEINDAKSLLNNNVKGYKNEDANLGKKFAGIGDVESVLKLFKEAPSEFPLAFGLEENEIVSLKYPKDAVYGEPGVVGKPGVAGQDHIVIEQFQYQPPQAIFLDKETKRDTLSFLNGMRRNSNIKRYIGMVRMPIPNNLNFTNGVSWGDSKLNSVQAAAFFSAFGGLTTTIGTGNIIKGLDRVGGDLASILGEISDGELKSGSPANLALSSFLAQFALGRAGINVDGNAALTRGTGAVVNPNLELLFNGPKLRNFTFQFQFAPNDEIDASEMRKIQKFFKMGMSPVRNQDNLVFLGSPNVFRLRYRTQEKTRIKGLPMHKICALTQCEINYTPDGVYQSYDDPSAGSSPVRTVMTMSFTELTPIFQDDYLGKNERMSKGSKVEKNEFNDLYTSVYGSELSGMEPITAEDTGF